MTWLQVWPAFVTAALLLFGPGAIVGAVMGARGSLLWAIAPAISLGHISGVAVLAQAFGIRFSVAAVLLLLAPVALIAWLVGRLLGCRAICTLGRSGLRPNAIVAVGLLAATPLISVRLARAIASPDNIAQSHDTLFHLNLVRYILDSGSGSSLTVGAMGTRDGWVYYPAAWHDLVALVVSTTGAAIPEAANASSIAIVSLAWPLGCMILARVALPQWELAPFFGAVLSAVFGLFPFLLFNFGVVYPWMTAIALLPAVLGLAGAIAQEQTHGRIAGTILGAGFVGLTAAHPGVAVTSIVLVGPFVLAILRRLWSTARQRALALLCVYVLVLTLSWSLLRPPRTSMGDNFGDPLSAILGSLLLLPPHGGSIAWVLVIAVFLGFIALILENRALWPFGLWLIGVAMNVASQWHQDSDLRWWLSGVWYSDPFRPASLLPVTSLPLMCIGVEYVRGRISSGLGGARMWSDVRRRWALVLAAGIATVLAGLNPALGEELGDVRALHRIDDHSMVLTTDELALIRRLPTYVPHDAMIAANPMTGAALSYALVNVRSVEPFAGLRRSAAGEVVMDRLDTMNSDPAVCHAVAKLKASFVLDFAGRVIDKGYREPGLEHLTRENGFALVAREGNARLYAVTGCRHLANTMAAPVSAQRMEHWQSVSRAE